MKLFKKLMAGAMAIAMLSAYVVAFAGSSNDSSTVSGVGSYAGSADPVFVMTLPTADNVKNSLAFTVDPQEIINNSPPANADSTSDYGTIIFQTKSGTSMIYTHESAPMKVISKSSVDVTVSMYAYLSDTKMTIFEGTPTTTSSGISFPAGNKNHVYFGMQVDTISGGSSTVSGATGGARGERVITGGTLEPSVTTVTALGAKNTTVLKAIPENFVTSVTSGGTIKTSVKSGGSNPELTDDSWFSAEYKVIGASNADADWEIDELKAPNLTIKWMVDPASKVTYPVTATPADATYTIQIDKDAYKKDDTVNVYVKPADSTKKVKSITMKYISISAKDGKMEKEVSVKGTPVGPEVDGTPTFAVTNGVYQATVKFPDPTTIAKSTTPYGATITQASQFYAPKFEVVLA